MNTLKEKQLAFLSKTVTHFNSGNRAVSMTITGPCCTYSHAVNGGCAIGKECSKELAEKLDSLKAPLEEIFIRLPDSLQELGLYFCSSIQRLHDNDNFWNENGLSMSGIEQMNKIKSHFELE